MAPPVGGRRRYARVRCFAARPTGYSPGQMVGLARRARWIVGLLPVFTASAAGGDSDADIYALIDALKPVAEAITVDDNPADWGAIPAFADPSGDAGGDGSRDVTSVRIAPTASALNVL